MAVVNCDIPHDLLHVSLLVTDQDVPRCYSAMDGRHTPQSRRPAPDREVQEVLPLDGQEI